MNSVAVKTSHRYWCYGLNLRLATVARQLRFILSRIKVKVGPIFTEQLLDKYCVLTLNALIHSLFRSIHRKRGARQAIQVSFGCCIAISSQVKVAIMRSMLCEYIVTGSVSSTILR